MTSKTPSDLAHLALREVQDDWRYLRASSQQALKVQDQEDLLARLLMPFIAEMEKHDHHITHLVASFDLLRNPETPQDESEEAHKA